MSLLENRKDELKGLANWLEESKVAGTIVSTLGSGEVSSRAEQSIMRMHLQDGTLPWEESPVKAALANIAGSIVEHLYIKKILARGVASIKETDEARLEYETRVNDLLQEGGLPVQTKVEKTPGIPEPDDTRLHLLTSVEQRLEGIEAMTYGEVLLENTEQIAAKVGSVSDVYSKGIGRVVGVYENVVGSVRDLYEHVPRQKSFFRELLSRIGSVFKPRAALMLDAMLYTVEDDINSILHTNIGAVISSGIPESLYELHGRIKDMKISGMTPTEEEIYGKMLMVPGPSHWLPIPKVLQDLAESFGKSVDNPNGNPLPLRSAYGMMHKISKYFVDLNRYVGSLRNDEDFASSAGTFINTFVRALSSNSQELQKIIGRLESRISQLEDVIKLASDRGNEKVLQRAQKMHAAYSNLVKTLRQGVTSQGQTESNINIGDTLVNIQKNIGQVNEELGNYYMHTQAILQIEGVRGR